MRKVRRQRMNSKISKFISNFIYTLSSNLISLFISTLVILIIPRIIGVQDYGYWQLYLFYTSYIGFFHLGWNDGIYLRYGGKDYDELSRPLFFSQFHMLVIFQLLITIILFGITYILDVSPDEIFILRMTVISLVTVNTRGMLLFILQATNDIKNYAKITIADRILYCLLIVLFIITGFKDYKVMVLADLIGKVVSFFYAAYICRTIVFNKVSTFYLSFKEAIENINVGIKLMFSNIASTLIIGVVRYGIQHTWDIETFGKVSLTLSVSNLIMVFINAVGIIMFPVLRRAEENNLPSIYITMRDFLMVVVFGLLILFYPVRTALLAWLPEYADGLKYMALLFPMCIYEGKMSLLLNTYLKTMRKERQMLKFNILTLGLALILTFVTTVMLQSLNLAVLSIVVLVAFRTLLAEIYLSAVLEISVYKDILLESLMAIVFILSAWAGDSLANVMVYAFAYLIYLLFKKKDITDTIKNLKILMRNK